MESSILLLGLLRTGEKFVEIYQWIVSLRVILYWFPNFNPYAFPFSIVTYAATPFLKIFTNLLPNIFGIDLSLYLGFLTLEALKLVFQRSQMALMFFEKL